MLLPCELSYIYRPSFNCRDWSTDTVFVVQGLDLNQGIFMCPICGKEPEISYGASNILDAAAERNPSKNDEDGFE